MRTAICAAMLTFLAACGGPQTDSQEEHVTDAEALAVQPPPAPEPAEEPAAEDVSDRAEAPPSSDALTADGWENLRIGMTKEEIAAAYGPDANPNAVGGPAPDQCDEFQPENAPAGMRVMLTDGRLARITIGRDAAVKTGEGLGLGAKADAVKAAYGGEAEVSPHKYVAAPAEYITVWTAGETDQPYVQDENARGLRYVVGMDGTVEQIHAGGPAIQLVEGCL